MRRQIGLQDAVDDGKGDRSAWAQVKERPRRGAQRVVSLKGGKRPRRRQIAQAADQIRIMRSLSMCAIITAGLHCLFFYFMRMPAEAYPFFPNLSCYGKPIHPAVGYCIGEEVRKEWRRFFSSPNAKPWPIGHTPTRLVRRLPL